MRNPKRTLKAALMGMVIAGGIYFLIVIATLSVFGAGEIKKLMWPTLELARMTSLPANILERLDAPFLVVWVTAVFTTLVSSYYITIHCVSNLLRLRDHKMFSFFLLPFVFIIAMSFQNVLQMYNYIEIIGRWGLTITILYPLVLLVVAVFRKKKGVSSGEARPPGKTN